MQAAKKPNRVALLKWPPTYGPQATLTINTNPFGVAFDGANYGQLRYLQFGSGPDDLVFDGANIWLANYSSGTVSKP